MMFSVPAIYGAVLWQSGSRGAGGANFMDMPKQIIAHVLSLLHNIEALFQVLGIDLILRSLSLYPLVLHRGPFV